jgi:hypothetical protein
LTGSAAATALAGHANAAMGPNDKFDLVIKGGDVLDPSQSLRGKRDIGIRYGLIDIVTRQRADVIQHPRYDPNMVRFLPGGDWLAFHMPMIEKQPVSRIYIAPLRNGAAAGESEWIQVTDGSGIEATPWSSADGSTLFFLSKREGFQCIWGQHLNPATKRPVGASFDAAHFHSARHKLRENGFGPGAAAGKLVFTMSDSTGNIWITKLEPPR